MTMHKLDGDHVNVLLDALQRLEPVAQEWTDTGYTEGRLGSAEQYRAIVREAREALTALLDSSTAELEVTSR